MHEQKTAQAGGFEQNRWSTPSMAIVGSTLFASGLFVLAAAGHTYPWQTHLFILAGAVALSLPLLLLTAIVAGSESLLGRAWANGLRRLPAGHRGWRATGDRALRYASVLWLANGAAMWLATFAAQL